MLPFPRAAGRRTIVAAILLLCTTPALAQVETGVGPSMTTGSEYTAAVFVAWLPRIRPLSNAVLRADLGAVAVAGRDDTPTRDLSDDVVVVHAGLRYERTDNGLSLGAGIGAQAGETDALSGDPQFVTTVGWRWDRVSLLLRHISNASRHEPNDGETMLMAAWRF